MITRTAAAWAAASLLVSQSTARAQEPRMLEVSSELFICLAFSPDGKTLATAGYDKTVKLWDTATGRLHHTLKGHTDAVGRLVFTPDGKTLASAGGDHTIRLWDAATGKERVAFVSHWGTLSLAISPDGKAFTRGDENGAVAFCDLTTGEKRTTFRGHKNIVGSAAFSPDGKILATASNDQTAKLWDVATGRELATLRGHTGHVHDVTFSPDGRTVATASNDRTARLWDVATGQEKARYEYEARSRDDVEVFCVAFAPDGKTLAGGCWERALLWDVDTKDQRAVLSGRAEHSGACIAVEFSHDGKLLATGYGGGIVQLWEVAQLPERGERSDR